MAMDCLRVELSPWKGKSGGGGGEMIVWVIKVEMGLVEPGTIKTFWQLTFSPKQLTTLSNE